LLNQVLQQLTRLRAIELPIKWQWAGCCVLAALCLLAGARLVALLLVEPVAPTIQFPMAMAAQRPAPIRLFPEIDRRAVVANEALSEASVNARLLGVIYLESRPLASMVVNSGKEAIYKVGDTLAPGVTVERIETLQVVVREGGGLRKISLASLLDNHSPIQMAPIHMAQSQMAPGAVAPNGMAASQSFARHGVGQLPLAATLAINEDGVSGLRIDRLGAELATMGLVEPGDLVIAVDGVALAELAADSTAMTQLAERDNLQLTVIRAGNRVAVDVDGATVRTLLGQATP
jgi:general secretion pathway protein C